MESTPKQMASPAPRNPRKTPYKHQQLILSRYEYTYGIIGGFTRRVGEAAQKVQNDVLPQTARDPIQNEQEEDGDKVTVSPVERSLWRIGTIVIAHADNFPCPCCNERNAHDCETDQGPCLALPWPKSARKQRWGILHTLLVIKNCLQRIAAWNLDDDGDERQQTPRPKVIVESVDRAAVH
jgi:hypothetical protein